MNQWRKEKEGDDRKRKEDEHDRVVWQTLDDWAIRIWQVELGDPHGDRSGRGATFET
jgi:hypothetical protein